ncbi:dGTPase [Stenotrophomonas maltophilia]|uniref:dGTPase n=1 Tax=Stenotrophomonas maltophilia TaxID=40324 RepID=UPI001953EC00|nr:dGTPase [Stenotrophomonas maltophilia]
MTSKVDLYEKILSSKRERKSTISRSGIVVEAESDRGRVLFCPSFRRLQQKAQVFSLESNAAVRSRLTHSLEVAQIGRLLAELIAEELVARDELTPTSKQAMMTFVETACLMHDIGNPPFGHFGEAAIQSWFTENGSGVLAQALGLGLGRSQAPLTPRAAEALMDFQAFDGNPQGLRIVSKLQGQRDDKGLNLTHTSLAAFLKYVRCSDEEPGNEPFRKKAGYFRSERKLVEAIHKTFSYDFPQRFPLAYIMEAADDIAYCVSDLEDSIEKGLVDWRQAFSEIQDNFLLKFPAGKRGHPSYKKIKRILSSVLADDAIKSCDFVAFRTSLNWVLVKDVVSAYIKNHDLVLSGSVETLLPKSEPSGAVLEELRGYCKRNVYPHDSVQRVELAGYAAIKGLLDQFRPLLTATGKEFMYAISDGDSKWHGRSMVIEKKLLSLFPNKHKAVYSKGDYSDCFAEWEARAHLVVDYISGMTDDFAVNTYRMLSGTRL